MVTYKPVSISKASFAFCRYSLAAMVWLAFLLKSQPILACITFIFLFSAILKVRRAPMIQLYDFIFNRRKKATEILVDENTMLFAHSLAAFISSSCLAAVHFAVTDKAWFAVLGFALLKTVSAFGFCPASKLYNCTVNGNCCIKKE